MVKIYPNPAKDIANIKLNQSAAKATISLIDMAGQKVYTTTVSSLIAGQVIHVPLYKLAAGVYVIKVVWDKGMVTHHLLVE